MDYIDAILWYMSWPFIVWIAYKFVMINLYHHAKMERLEMLEEHFGDKCSHSEPMLEIKKVEKVL
jgi:hypothetical protein